MISCLRNAAARGVRVAFVLATAIAIPAIADAQSLVTSESSNRSAPIALAGSTASDDIHVFTTPDTGVVRVRFWLDQPTFAGTPFRTENNAPFDFAGGTVATATPFDTNDIADGTHTISARLDLTGGGTLDLHATFTVANQVPSLSFSPGSSGANLVAGATGSATVSLTTSNGTVTSPVLQETASWLTVTPSGSATPLSITLGFDTAGLATGTYTANVTAQSAGYVSATLPVTLVVGSPAPTFQILNSSSANRSSPAPLAGQAVAGDIHVFTSPATGVTRVQFWIDNPSLTGTPYRTENTAPHDLNGGTVALATPYDSEDLADGAHTISARIELTGGGVQVLHAGFTVANGAALLQFVPDSIVTSLGAGAQETFPIDIVTSTGVPASFTVTESVPWLSVAPVTGTTPASVVVTIDTAGLGVGSYSGSVQASAAGFLPASLDVDLVVASTAPSEIHLTWVGNPSTTMTVTWRTAADVSPTEVEYRVAGAPVWSLATGAVRATLDTGVLRETTLTGLVPSTDYEYRVRGDGAWSGILTTRTAPPPGPADFTVVYFGDTGIVGRLDGLTTGTAQCIDEIAALDPLLVLGGGDYAYYNTDPRFDSLDEAMDAWFEQMEPVASRAPMMPTYGNHEVFLGEGFAPWAERFPTPSGFDGRRNYSFDVGDVHFISVFAAEDGGGLRPGTVAWLDADMTAAEAAGARWIVPFMHVAPFSDGANHPSALPLRAALGPLFEAHDVKVVLTCHDQSYERTWPIVGVPSAITATSDALDCYEPDDGITWVKVSPAGKLSNQNGDFSPWETVPPPPWTAFRHNTLHHFARLIVSAAGTLEVEIIGLTGTGAAPVVIDSFHYTLGSCPAALELDPGTLAFSVEEDESDSATVAIASSDGAAHPFEVSSDASWLTALPSAGTTPSILTVTVDANGLAPGSYTGTISATSTAVGPSNATVQLSVTPDGHSIFVSTSALRTSPLPLAGRVVDGDIFVFTSPDAGVSQVRFHVDDPTLAGTPFRIENTPPFDLAGGSAGVANPFDTENLADGSHTISAVIVLSAGGSVVLHAGFTVANDALALLVSPASLSLSAGASAAPATGTVQLSTIGPAASFTVAVPAGAGWLSVLPATGVSPASLTFTAAPAGLSPGTRNATVTISAPGFLPASVPVSFEVIDDTPALQFSAGTLAFTSADGASAPPDQVVQLTSPGGIAAAVLDVSASATWLSFDPEGGDTPIDIEIGVDPTGFAPGNYAATLTATAPGYQSATLSVSFTIGEPYEIVASFSANRANPFELAGQTISGPIHIFTSPDDPEIDFVDFWLDDPTMQSPRYRREGTAPFDLNGGSVNAAEPLETEEIDDGEHTVTAAFGLFDGSTVVVHSTFIVLNDAPSLDFPVEILAFPLDLGEQGSETIAVTATNGSTAAFAVDPITVPWLTVTVLDSTTPGQLLVEVDTAGLAPGIHLATVRVTASSLVAETMTVRLTIGVPGLAYFAGDDDIDTAVSIEGDDWYINGEVTYPGRVWVNPANGQSRVIEGLLMNARLVQAVYDDLDGDIAVAMSPWDPRENTEDFIENMPIWRAHGLLAFNIGFQGGGNPSAASADVDCNPFGPNGRRCFDDWYAGLDTPYSQFLVRAGSIIRAADDLGMVVELSPFYWGQDQRLVNEAAVYAAMDGVLDWVLENGWTNVLIEVANESSYQPNGVYAFNHPILQTAGTVTLMDHVQDYTSGPEGAHLPHGRLLTSVSGHGGYIPNDPWIVEADYVIFHGNGVSASSTATKLDQILARDVYEADPKPIYTNEHSTDLTVIDPHLQRHASWGYHGRNQYQRVFPTTDTARWTIAKDPAWWNKLSEITGESP